MASRLTLVVALAALAVGDALRLQHSLRTRALVVPRSARCPVILAQETEKKPEPPADEAAAEPEQPAPTTGYTTVYDDETPQADPKEALSASMRERLIREQRGLGADPNSGSPFLLVFAGVGIFVLLGALAVNS